MMIWFLLGWFGRRAYNEWRYRRALAKILAYDGPTSAEVFEAYMAPLYERANRVSMQHGEAWEQLLRAFNIEATEVEWRDPQ